MASDIGSTVQIQNCLAALRDGKESARRELIEYAQQRFDSLARTMIKDYPQVRRWEETGDILQAAMIRLWRALESFVPQNALAFRRLAALELRRELIDLARKYKGPHGLAKNYQTDARRSDDSEAGRQLEPAAASTDSPVAFADWSDFHERVSELPEKARDVFELRYYHGMLVEEVAAELGVSKATVKLRWVEALRLLRDQLGGKDLPAD